MPPKKNESYPNRIHVTGIFAHTSWSHKNQSIHGSLNIPFLYVSSCLPHFSHGIRHGTLGSSMTGKKNTFFHTSLLTNVKASPAAPARPVLPTPWGRREWLGELVEPMEIGDRPKIQSNWYWYNVYTFFSTYYLFIVHVFMVYIKYSVYIMYSTSINIHEIRVDVVWHCFLANNPFASFW